MNDDVRRALHSEGLVDPSNPIVRLCTEGMKAEGEGRFEEARLLFMQAWEARGNDYEACVAAHFVARHQESPGAALRWNQAALAHADAVEDESVGGFYPSLYLNIGKSYEDLGEIEKARRYYEMAACLAGDLPTGRYRDIVLEGIATAQARTRLTGAQRSGAG